MQICRCLDLFYGSLVISSLFYMILLILVMVVISLVLLSVIGIRSSYWRSWSSNLSWSVVKNTVWITGHLIRLSVKPLSWVASGSCLIHCKLSWTQQAHHRAAPCLRLCKMSRFRNPWAITNDISELFLKRSGPRSFCNWCYHVFGPECGLCPSTLIIGWMLNGWLWAWATSCIDVLLHDVLHDFVTLR